jgi:hypothetical protein
MRDGTVFFFHSAAEKFATKWKLFRRTKVIFVKLFWKDERRGFCLKLFYSSPPTPLSQRTVGIFTQKGDIKKTTPSRGPLNATGRDR